MGNISRDIPVTHSSQQRECRLEGIFDGRKGSWSIFCRCRRWGGGNSSYFLHSFMLTLKANMDDVMCMCMCMCCTRRPSPPFLFRLLGSRPATHIKFASDTEDDDVAVTDDGSKSTSTSTSTSTSKSPASTSDDAFVGAEDFNGHVSDHVSNGDEVGVGVSVCVDAVDGVGASESVCDSADDSDCSSDGESSSSSSSSSSFGPRENHPSPNLDRKFKQQQQQQQQQQQSRRLQDLDERIAQLNQSQRTALDKCLAASRARGGLELIQGQWRMQYCES